MTNPRKQPKENIDTKVNPIKFVRIETIGKQKRNIWLFECQCGNQFERRLDKYNEGRVKSCGKCKKG